MIAHLHNEKMYYTSGITGVVDDAANTYYLPTCFICIMTLGQKDFL